MNRPVTILTGFLGAGKTTFLNFLAQSNASTRYAIIENEFGEQGIDGALVVRPDDTIVELNHGCLCCTLHENLYDILNALFDRRGEFDEIIIEATGVADPTGLAQPFLSHPLIKEHFPLKGIICLVDAELIASQLVETEEAKNQVAFSDVLLINKTDLVTTNAVLELNAKLQLINPLAEIVQGNKAGFPRIELSPKQSPLDKIFKAATVSYGAGAENHFPVSKPHRHHDHEHTKAIASHTFCFDHPFDDVQLSQQLYVYLMLYASNLYRMKGLVWIDGAAERYLVQSVGNRLDTTKMDAWPAGEKRKSVLVFIGKDLAIPEIEKMLTNCLSKNKAVQS